MKYAGGLIFCLVVSAASLFAQPNIPAVDKSGMDMSFYPVNYPILKIQDKLSGPLIARVIYSRPHKNGRSVFGELLHYGDLWRLGANEATEIELFKDVKINGTALKKGRYTLYCLPTPEKWTIIFNRETDTWGAFKYDSTKDVLRATVPVVKQKEPLEVFSIWFEKTSTGADMLMAWDHELARLPLHF